jgi:cytochrome oxidase Cu insertion factor (SCO1/SenC/PrrC family)
MKITKRQMRVIFFIFTFCNYCLSITGVIKKTLTFLNEIGASVDVDLYIM